MKKTTSIVTSIILLATPISAIAATTLHINQQVTSAHTGGLLNEDFGSIDISYGGRTNWGHINMVGSGSVDFSFDDSPVFPVQYSVSVGSDPRGIFVPTLGSDCSGVMQKDENRTCQITWLDTGPKSTQPQAPVSNNVNIPIPQPTPVAIQATTNSSSSTSTNVTTSTDTDTKIAALRKQVAELLQILVQLLTQKLRHS